MSLIQKVLPLNLDSPLLGGGRSDPGCQAEPLTDLDLITARIRDLLRAEAKARAAYAVREEISRDHARRPDSSLGVSPLGFNRGVGLYFGGNYMWQRALLVMLEG